MNDGPGTVNKGERRSLFRLRKWHVYLAAKSFRKRIRMLAESLPESERYLLRDQMRRAFFSEAVRDKAISMVQVEPGRLAADSGVGTGFIAQVSIFVGYGEK